MVVHGHQSLNLCVRRITSLFGYYTGGDHWLLIGGTLLLISYAILWKGNQALFPYPSTKEKSNLVISDQA